jgi:hypothetical protein
MVALNFNAHAVFFESGLDTIQDGYDASVTGITHEINRKKAALYDYDRHIANGGGPTEERDEDGRIIWAQDQTLEALISVAEDALGTLRKAYAISIYHHWERSALSWTGRTNEKHDKLVRLVLAEGYPIDPHLEAVRDLANLLKHANERWGLQLFQSWPNVFQRGFAPVAGGGPVKWYDRVELTGAHIKEVMKTVRESGPKNPQWDF